MFEQNGTDATEVFNDVGHSSDARETMKKFKVGELVLVCIFLVFFLLASSWLILDLGFKYMQLYICIIMCLQLVPLVGIGINQLDSLVNLCTSISLVHR